MSFSATARPVDNVLMVDLSGRMAKGEALEELRTIIRDALISGSVQFAFHVAGLTDMDADGRKEFHECFAKISIGKNKLKLIQVPQKIEAPN